MNTALNKLIVIMGLFCLLLGYQNFGRVSVSEVGLVPPSISFESLIGEVSSSVHSCSVTPSISKGPLGKQTWFKADWGGSTCAKPSFVGWSVYDSEGELVTSLENGTMLGYGFSKSGKYKVILNYSALHGSGQLLLKSPGILQQIQFDIEIQ